MIYLLSDYYRTKAGNVLSLEYVWLSRSSICFCYCAIHELKFLMLLLLVFHVFDIKCYANCLWSAFYPSVEANCIEEFPLTLKSVIGEILVPDSGPKGHCFRCLGVVEYINLKKKEKSFYWHFLCICIFILGLSRALLKNCKLQNFKRKCIFFFSIHTLTYTHIRTQTYAHSYTSAHTHNTHACIFYIHSI